MGDLTGKLGIVSRELLATLFEICAIVYCDRNLLTAICEEWYLDICMRRPSLLARKRSCCTLGSCCGIEHRTGDGCTNACGLR